MAIETWIAFAAAAILIALLPSPLANLIARYAMQRGRRTALLTIPGTVIGLGLALTLAAMPVAAIAWAAPALLEPLSWVGLAYLMLYALWSFQEPSARSPVAHNDNLPEQQSLRIFTYLVASCVRNGRYVCLLAALLAQFVQPQMLAFQSVMMDMHLGFMSLVAAGALVHVVFPHRILNRVRPRPATRPASHKMGTRFIARRAVTAGYRRIAA